MIKSARISLLFILIFLTGILGVIALVNKTLNEKSDVDFHISPHTFISAQSSAYQDEI